MIIRCSENRVCLTVHTSALSLVGRWRFGNKELTCHLPLLTCLLNVCTFISHTRFSFITHCYFLLHPMTMLYICHGMKQTVAITVTGRSQTTFLRDDATTRIFWMTLTHSRRYWTNASLLDHFKNDFSSSASWMTPRHTRVVVPNPISPTTMHSNQWRGQWN